LLQDQISLKVAGELTDEEKHNLTTSSMKLQTEAFTAEKVRPK